MWIRISALPLCLLAVVALGSALPSTDSGIQASEKTSTAERRTLKLPLKKLKKIKKFNHWLPHVFGKTEYTGIPTPIYKVHRYHGIEVKPVNDVDEVAPLISEPVAESHAFVPPTTNFVTFVPDNQFQQAVLPQAPFVFDPASYSANPTFSPSPLPFTTSFVFQPNPLSITKPVTPEVHNLQHTFTVTSTPAPPLSVVTPNPVNIPPPVTADATFLPPLSLPHSFSTLPLTLPSPPPLPALPIFPTPSTQILTSISDVKFPYPPKVGLPLVKDTIEEHNPEKIALVEPSVTVVEEDHDPNVKQVFVKPKPGLAILRKIKGWKVDKVASVLNHLNKIKSLKQPSIASISVPERVTESTTVNFQAPTVTPALSPVHYPEPIHTTLIHPPQVFLSTVTPSYNFVPENIPWNWNKVPQQPQLFNSYGVPIPPDSYAPPLYFSHERASTAAAATEEKSSVLPAPPSFTERLQQTSPVESEPKGETHQQQQQPPAQNVQDDLTAQDYPIVLPQAIRADFRPVYRPEESKTGDKDSKSIEEIFEETRNENPETTFSTERNQSSEVNVQNYSDEKKE